METMSAWAESGAAPQDDAMAPLLAAVENSGVVAAGSGAMEEVLAAMELRLERILDRAEGEAGRIRRQAAARTSSRATEARRQIAQLRATLVERATALANAHDALLDLLDDAERALDGMTDGNPSR